MNIPVPFERLEIETKLAPEEVAKRLRDVTEPAKFFRLRAGKSKEFQGSVGEREFRISRIIRYRNSFLPILRGRIEPTATGTSVQVAMRPYGFVLAFMGVWFGGVTIFFVAMLAIVIANQEFTPLVFAPLGFYAFGYALTTGGFKLESKRNRERLQELLASESIDQAARSSFWPEDAFRIRWSDIKAAGPLGLLWVSCYVVAAALALYDWIIRRAGCTNKEAHDPRYFCPSDARVFTVWGVFTAMIVATGIGIWPIQRRRPALLVPIIAIQIVAIIALAWIARNSGFHAHRR